MQQLQEVKCFLTQLSRSERWNFNPSTENINFVLKKKKKVISTVFELLNLKCSFQFCNKNWQQSTIKITFQVFYTEVVIQVCHVIIMLIDEKW